MDRFFFPLPTNDEQRQIIYRLYKSPCVVVKGPPGTGKTHTIANLIGHLLAQGKRILVTAQTPKALKVLREKIVEPLQPLCVSVLQKDRQNNEQLQQSVRQMNIRLAQSEHQLEIEAARLQEERLRVLAELRLERERLLVAREDEIREIVYAGKGIRPIDAAKCVLERQEKDSWIPSPVTLGEGAPLSHADVIVLYQSSAKISLDDERELVGARPDLAKLPTPAQLRDLIKESNVCEAQELDFGKEFWDDNVEPADFAEFENLLTSASKAIEFLKECSIWQMEAVQAGCDGEPARGAWTSLADSIEQTWKEIQECYSLVMEYGPIVADQRPADELLLIVDEMIGHVEKNGTHNFLTRITKSHWYTFIGAVQINGRVADVTQVTHLRAVRAHLRSVQCREELKSRWSRQMVPGGAPSLLELGDKPEQVCRQFVQRIHAALDWHLAVWLPLEADLERLGFRWKTYLDSVSPEVGDNAQLNRLRLAILGDLRKILQMRATSLHVRRLKRMLASWQSQLFDTRDGEASVTQRLRQALKESDFATYSVAYEEVRRFEELEHDLLRRNELLDTLVKTAPAWASAIRNHLPTRDSSEPPGNPMTAWEWRQLRDELERRAATSLEHLQQRIETLNVKLLEVTAQLVEKQTWLYQVKNIAPDQKHALGAYATLRSKLTKSGQGKKDAEVRSAMRREMEIAKGAVPVWIMPLSEVAEVFDPCSTRFDVVIIDEASQCDPLAMFALYLGKQAIVVGDDEQVSPLTIGLEAEETMKLTRTFLENVPHKELYDGETSIYDFARIAFGGVIRLVEHFRCAPDIISFSNNLCYQGEIKPLREENSVVLSPHVVPHRIDGGRVDDAKVNLVEAQTVASLVCAAIEQPEYAYNEFNQPMTFGISSLLGDQQAGEIEKILHAKLAPEVYLRRQILCGNPAHFQGDERDVMFLSMVDSPTGGPMPLRDPEANKRIFKKRYNVAASRARDQMWLVYSLNHETDLKPGDIRRSFIEYAIDPKAKEREIERYKGKTESPFEERVLRHLISRGYSVQPQYRVGAYRIDLVVTGGGKRLAVECDGEQWHGHDKLQEDMERQAILERLGWQFVRIRGSVFFRDPDRAMAPVFRRLEELSIPVGEQASDSVYQKSELIDRVRRRAEELMREWGFQTDAAGLFSGSVNSLNQ